MDLITEKVSFIKITVVMQVVFGEKCQQKPMQIGNKRELNTLQKLVTKYPNKFVDYSKATLKEMSVQFLESRENTSVGNYSRVKGRWDRHILPYFKNKAVSEITTEDTERFAKQLITKVGHLECREVFVVLKAYFNWDLENEKCLSRMPISKGLQKSIADNRKRAQRKKGTVGVKMTDMDRIYAAAKGRDDEIVYQWLARNLRLGETQGVRVKDVDLAKGKVFLNNQVQAVPKDVIKGTKFEDSLNMNGSSTYQSETLKTERSHRPIDLINGYCSTDKLSDIRELLAELMKDKQPDDLLFTTRNGTPCTPNNFRRRHLKPLLKKLGLEDSKITPQVFREYFFSKGANSDEDSAKLSMAMGHTNLSTSMKYYFIDIEEEDKPLEKKVIKKSKSFKSVITNPKKSEVANYSKVIEYSKQRLAREKKLQEKYDSMGAFFDDIAIQSI